MSEVKQRLENSKTGGHILFRLLGYILQYWHLAVISLIFSFFSNYLALLGPRYLGAAMDAISNKNGVLMDQVLYNFWRMLVCYVISAVLSYLLTFFMVHLSQSITYRMRKQLFEKLTVLPVSYFDTHTTGDIISRISYDIDTVNASLCHFKTADSGVCGHRADLDCIHTA